MISLNGKYFEKVGFVFFPFFLIGCGIEEISQLTNWDALPSSSLTQHYIVITTDTQNICNDVSFLDKSGQMVTGTRDCQTISIKPEDLKAGITVGQVQGTLGACTQDGQTQCLTSSDYAASDSSTIATKLLSGQTAGGVAGSASSATVPLCTSDGQLSCETNNDFKASATAGLANKLLSGQVAAQTTGTYTPDFPDQANVLSSDTVAGLPGTLILPGVTKVRASRTYGIGGTGSTGTLIVPTVSTVSTAISYGAGGTEYTGIASLETHSNCSGANQSGCITTFTYPSIDLSSQGSGGAVELNATNFNTRMRSSSSFEYWDENGVRHTSNGDSDLIATNISSSINIFGVVGTVIASPANCNSSGQQDCVVQGAYFAATACASSGVKDCFISSGSSYDSADLSNLSSNNIKSGITINGVLGNIQLPNPNDVSDGVSFGAPADLLTGNFVSPAISNVAAGVQYGPTGSLITGTASVESHSNCTADGEINCVTTATFLPTDSSTLASKLLSGQTVGGIGGNVSLPSAGVVLSGTNYGVSGTSLTGTLTLPNTTNVLTGSGLYGNPSSLQTPSYSPDFPDTANVLSTDTVNGSAGTLVDRGTWNLNNAFPGSGYYSGVSNTPSSGQLRRGTTYVGVTGNYPSATSPLERYSDTGSSSSTSGSDITDLSNLTIAARTVSTFEYWNSSGQRLTGTGDSDIIAANIKSSVEILGVTGSMIESPSNCSSGGQQNCVATGSYTAAQACTSNGQAQCYTDSSSSYDAADLSNLSAGTIKSGVTIAGQLGDYPSSTYPLPSASATADLTATNFNTQMKSASSFEYWESDGTYHTGSGDTDIVSSNIATGVNIFSTTGTYSGPPPTPSNFQATANGSSQIDLSWNTASVTGFIVVSRENSAVSFSPSNGSSYSTGSQGSDEIIYVGSGTSYNHSSGVSAGNTYHYAIYSYNATNEYSVAAIASLYVGNPECGGAGDSCYDDTDAMTAGVAQTPGGKSIEYVFANGSSGVKVWKEVSGNRILRANGSDSWAKDLNLTGRSLSSTDFTDSNLGSSSTLIKGRACPDNVYISNSNKFSTDNCLYYTDGTRQALSAAGQDQTGPTTIGLGPWTNYDVGQHNWYKGNVRTCSDRGMRLPTVYETITTNSSYSNYPNDSAGDPTAFAGSNGINPGVRIWTATHHSSDIQRYLTVDTSGNIGTLIYYTSSTAYVVCVLP